MMRYILTELEMGLNSKDRGAGVDKLYSVMEAIVHDLPDAPQVFRSGGVDEVGYCRLVRWYNRRIRVKLVLGASFSGYLGRGGPYVGLPLTSKDHIVQERAVHHGNVVLFCGELESSGEGSSRGSVLLARRAGVEMWRVELARVEDSKVIGVKYGNVYDVSYRHDITAISSRGADDSVPGVTVFLTPQGELLFYVLHFD